MMGNILGVYFASRGTFKVKDSLLNVLKVPIAYAAGLGLLFNIYNIELPLIIQRSVIDIASGASIPLMLALLGLHLSRVSFKQIKQHKKAKNDTHEESLASDIRAITVGVGLKLLIAPLVAVGFAIVLGLRGTVLSVAIVQSSMPTAVFATALATEFGSDAPYVTAVTIVSTLLSIITLTVLLFILGGVAI
ncbi:MAG: AEC family transporter [Anaerolineae bacterium]|nr:AEC family transporter [Anaerolineae bacterium]